MLLLHTHPPKKIHARKIVVFLLLFIVLRAAAGLDDNPDLNSDSKIGISYLIKIKQELNEQLYPKQKSNSKKTHHNTSEPHFPPPPAAPPNGLEKNECILIQGAVITLLSKIGNAINSGKDIYTGKNERIKMELGSREIWDDFMNLLGRNIETLTHAFYMDQGIISKNKSNEKSTGSASNSKEKKVSLTLQKFQEMAKGILNRDIPMPDKTLSNTVNNTQGGSAQHAKPEKKTDKRLSTGFDQSEEHKSVTKVTVHREPCKPSKHSQPICKVTRV